MTDLDIRDATGEVFVATDEGVRVVLLSLGAPAEVLPWSAYGWSIAVQPQYSAVGTGVPPAAVEPPLATLRCYPNPIASQARIEYTLPAPADVVVGVYDLSGRLVAALEKGARAAGAHQVLWAGTSDEGGDVAAGVYFVRVETGGETLVGKAVLLK